MNHQDANNESIIIEDLPAENTEDVKGGPSTQSKRDVILKTSFAGEDGTTLNHNETMSEDSEADTKRLPDLAVDEEAQAGIKGGLPAVQKVREAAAGISSSGLSAGKVSYSDISIY